MDIKELYQVFTAHPNVTTDTRTLQKDDLFFALTGPAHNGNEYITTALEKGAYLCISDDKTQPVVESIVQVPDVLTCLQELAAYHRNQFTIPFIAITGSNGKTTTKELVHAVMSKKYICYTTVGNLNNHIGVPLTLLRIKHDAEIAIIEMGANHQKEIEGYCTYARPGYGLITNIGKAHLEGFGSVEGIKKGKGELFQYLALNKGTAFINTDYDYLQEMSSIIKNKITYGTVNANYEGKLIPHETALSFSMIKGAAIDLINTNLVGAYNLPNALAAVCIGKTFGVEEEDIKNALENYAPDNSRSQLLKIDSNTFILDAYNANPSSMKAAIENIGRMEGKNKVLYLGAMKEMGPDSSGEHVGLVSLLDEYSWKDVILVGQEFEGLTKHFHYCENTAEAQEWFKKQAYTNCTILIKGSRSMAMEKVIAD